MAINLMELAIKMKCLVLKYNNFDYSKSYRKCR